jgi:hypothetical protein
MPQNTVTHPHWYSSKTGIYIVYTHLGLGTFQQTLFEGGKTQEGGAELCFEN